MATVWKKREMSWAAMYQVLETCWMRRHVREKGGMKLKMNVSNSIGSTVSMFLLYSGIF